MKKNSTKILDDIVGNLRHFFNESETHNIQAMMLEERNSDSVLGASSESVEPQLDDFGHEGSNFRKEIDRFLTFVTDRISRDTHQKLSLAIAEALAYKGEFETAEEILNNEFHNKQETQPGTTADMFLLKAKIAWNNSEWKSAKKYCKKALEEYSQDDNKKGMCSCSNILGNIYGETGDLKKAEKHYKKALELISDDGNEELHAMLTTNLGIIADMRGDIVEAEKHYLTAKELYKRLDNEFQLGRLNHNLGMLNLQKQAYTAAIEFFDNSINLSMANSHHSNYAVSLIGKATVYMKQAQYELAGNYADKAFEVSFKINDRLTIAEVYRIKGLIQKEQMNYQLAEEYLNMSIRLNENFSNEFNSVESSLDLSRIYYELNRKEQADILTDRAMRYYKEQKIERPN